MLRRDLLVTGMAAVAGAHALPALAQDFPRAGASLKYVVPFPPGGLTDVMARIVAQKVSESWKVPFVVENKAGGNAQIGADQVAKGPSDGSQLLAITLTHAANVSLFPDAPYSFTKDLRPVALLAGSPLHGDQPRSPRRHPARRAEPAVRAPAGHRRRAAGEPRLRSPVQGDVGAAPLIPVMTPRATCAETPRQQAPARDRFHGPAMTLNQLQTQHARLASEIDALAHTGDADDTRQQ